MKLRASTNSIRIRVRKSDLEQLKATDWVYEEVAFPGGGKWSFGLTMKGDTITARLSDNTVIVNLPREEAMAWINSEQVGIECNLPLEGKAPLHLLIEKDFPCKADEENIADTFFELNKGTC